MKKLEERQAKLERYMTKALTSVLRSADMNATATVSIMTILKEKGIMSDEDFQKGVVKIAQEVGPPQSTKTTG